MSERRGRIHEKHDLSKTRRCELLRGAEAFRSVEGNIAGIVLVMAFIHPRFPSGYSACRREAQRMYFVGRFDESAMFAADIPLGSRIPVRCCHSVSALRRMVVSRPHRTVAWSGPNVLRRRFAFLFPANAGMNRDPALGRSPRWGVPPPPPHRGDEPAGPHADPVR